MSFPDLGLYCSFILPLLFCVLLLVLKWQVMIFMYFAGMSSGGLSLPIGVAFFLSFFLCVCVCAIYFYGIFPLSFCCSFSYEMTVLAFRGKPEFHGSRALSSVIFVKCRNVRPLAFQNLLTLFLSLTCIWLSLLWFCLNSVPSSFVLVWCLVLKGGVGGGGSREGVG